MAAPIGTAVQQAVDSAVTQAGFELFSLTGGGTRNRPLLEVRIDRADGTKVTIDDCALVSRAIEAVLDGRKLMPHWRFEKGFNVRRFFEESKRIDAVLITAGVDAIPFLEAGPVSKSADWENLTRVFSGNFLGYAIWFN